MIIWNVGPFGSGPDPIITRVLTHFRSPHELRAYIVARYSAHIKGTGKTY